ncbi:MAG TPA: ABC transporter substrate binding protein [Candidatus Polarisedimenticolia bacterium]|nr:ABC transporter substrate binding protein [Candidatus Polarisedimenticolia bacterium]
MAPAIPVVVACLLGGLAAPALATEVALITGRVLDTDGRPLAGAHLTLSGDGVRPSSAVTNGRGVYRFQALRPLTTYTVGASYPGFRDLEYDGFYLEPSRTRRVDFRLKRPGEREVVVLASRDPFGYEPLVEAFREAVGVPVRVVDLDREPDPAARVRQIRAERPNLILGAGLRAARLVRSDVPDIPAILTLIDDPRRYDLKAENICFLSNNPPAEEVLQRFALILPGARRIGLLFGSGSGSLVARDLRQAAEHRGLHALLRPCYSRKDLHAALESLRGQVDALLIPYDPITSSPQALKDLGRWALRARIPMAAPSTEWVRQGALFSYGAPLASLGKEAAFVAGQILSQSGHPEDFALRQPESHVLAVNTTTALALGIEVPPGVAVDETYNGGRRTGP